jgi:hypothetical protein
MPRANGSPRIGRSAPSRDGQSPTHGRRPDLRSTLCPIHSGWHRREDDIDAPDLCAGPTSLSSSTGPERALQRGDGNSPGQPQGTGNGRGRGTKKSEPRVILDPAQSAQLRKTSRRPIAPPPGQVRRLWPRTASPQPMPSSWRTLSNGSYRTCHQPMRLHPRTTGLRSLQARPRCSAPSPHSPDNASKSSRTASDPNSPLGCAMAASLDPGVR